jgi:hypothetical protein
VDCADQAGIDRIDGQDERDRQPDLDSAGDIHPIAGGLNFAATKKPSASGTKNFAQMWGMKNAPQMMRRIFHPFVRSKFCK